MGVVQNLTLEYHLTRADFEAFFAHHARHAPYIANYNRRMRWIWGVAFALLAIILSLRSLVGGFIFLGLAVAFFSLYGPLNRWWYVRHNRRLLAAADGPRFGHTTLSLADSQLHIRAVEGTSTLELSSIRRIEASPSHYFLYTGPSNAIIVPRINGQADALVNAVLQLQGA